MTETLSPNQISTIGVVRQWLETDMIYKVKGAGGAGKEGLMSLTLFFPSFLIFSSAF